MRDDQRPFYETLGASIRDARNGAGMSQAQLGRRLGLTRASVGNIEAGRQTVSAYDLAVLAGLISVAVPWVDRSPSELVVAGEHARMSATLRRIRTLVAEHDLPCEAS